MLIVVLYHRKCSKCCMDGAIIVIVQKPLLLLCIVLGCSASDTNREIKCLWPPFGLMHVCTPLPCFVPPLPCHQHLTSPLVGHSSACCPTGQAWHSAPPAQSLQGTGHACAAVFPSEHFFGTTCAQVCNYGCQIKCKKASALEAFAFECGSLCFPCSFPSTTKRGNRNDRKSALFPLEETHCCCQ